MTRSRPSLCLSSLSSLPFLVLLELFVFDSFVLLPESELVDCFVLTDSSDASRGSLVWDGMEDDPQGTRDGLVMSRGWRAFRISSDVLRIISSTDGDTDSAPSSAVFRAKSNWVSKCLTFCWSRLFSFSKTSSCEDQKISDSWGVLCCCCGCCCCCCCCCCCYCLALKRASWDWSNLE